MILCLLLVGGAIFYVHWQVNQAMPIKETQFYQLKPGKSFHHVLKDFKKNKWITSRVAYRLYSKLHPATTHVKSGMYQFQPNMSFLSALTLLTKGHEYQFKITFVEGTTFKEWQKKMAQAEHLISTLQGKSYSQVMANFSKKFTHPEGLFFPDTYAYTAGTTDVEILNKAYTRMSKELSLSWQQKAAKLPYKTPYEALIMASIIEKETGQIKEQPIISSVFYNRLKKRMRLQTDPTIIYGLGERYTGDITYANIREKTAYNTYQISGLPPTPIAMPGKSAIEASMHPANTSFLYFVSKGNGEHYFSKTLAEHNKAVRRYIKGIK